MDRISSFFGGLLNPRSATPGTDLLLVAQKQITGLTHNKTTDEQLHALAYAWGNQATEETRAYAPAFEKCKKAYLRAVAGTFTDLESRKQFHLAVRAGIHDQLPPHLRARLAQAYQACEEKMAHQNPPYNYDDLKRDMQEAIKRLIAEEKGDTTGQTTDKTTATTSTATAVGPDGRPPADAPRAATTSTGVPSAAAPGDMPPAIASAPLPPLSAPPHLAFLDSFRSEWRSHPAWGRVIAGMDSYLSSFDPYRGEGQRALLASDPAGLVKAVESIALYTSLPDEEAATVAYRRELVNMTMRRDFDEASNERILGCKTSGMMQTAVAAKPGNQLSLSMRVPIYAAPGAGGKPQPRPVVLSVCAPALDSARQPEWPHYVRDGKFDQDAYRLSFTTLAAHIKACAAAHPGAQVVLSGFGLANFLGHLPPSDQQTAKKVGAEVFIGLIRDLRDKGVDLAYTDYSGKSPPWPAVNQALGNDSIACVGSIPGDWIKDEQIIVNAWDPHALVGNGCAQDNSLDGYIGRYSLVHEAHALACMLRAGGIRT